MTPNEPFVITTNRDWLSREDIEVCARTGAPIIAFEQSTGETFCEKCIYEGRAKNPVFMATVARQVKEMFDEQYGEFCSLCGELEEINQIQIWERLQTQVTNFFGLLR